MNLLQQKIQEKLLTKIQKMNIEIIKMIQFYSFIQDTKKFRTSLIDINYNIQFDQYLVGSTTIMYVYISLEIVYLLYQVTKR